jgi:hypothetical protein
MWKAIITKNIGLLEKLGLIVSSREANPGHGIRKVVRTVVPKKQGVSDEHQHAGPCGVPFFKIASDG